MRFAHLLGRLVATAALVVAASWFALSVGAPSTRLYADVIGPLARAAGFVPAPSGSTVRVGRAFVNGQPFQYVVGQSAMTVDRVLDHYERQLKAPGRAGPSTGVARIQGREAGVLIGYQPGPLLLPADVAGRPPALDGTLRLGRLVRMHVVSVYAKPQGAVFINFLAGDDVRVDALMPKGTDHAPGTDVPGVTRPPEVQGLLSIEHGEGPAWSRTSIFRAADPKRSIAGFDSAFAAAGWTRNPLVEAKDVLHVTNGKFESFVGASGYAKEAVVIVVTRLAGSPER